MVRENKGKEEHCEKHSIFAQGCFVYDLVFIDGIKEKLLSIAIIVAISSGSLHSTSGFDQGLNARNDSSLYHVTSTLIINSVTNTGVYRFHA